MKHLTILIFAIFATGCTAYGNIIDRQDPCQNIKSAPSFCGVGNGPAYTTRDYYSNRIVYQTKRSQ